VTAHEYELNEVRQYLQNSLKCRRKRLLQYYDAKNAKPGDDPKVCCDVCASAAEPIEIPSTSNDCGVNH